MVTGAFMVLFGWGFIGLGLMVAFGPMYFAWTDPLFRSSADDNVLIWCGVIGLAIAAFGKGLLTVSKRSIVNMAAQPTAHAQYPIPSEPMQPAQPDIAHSVTRRARGASVADAESKVHPAIRRMQKKQPEV